MRSTFAGLNTMVRGLVTSQLQLDTVGHNITNTDTDGYSRQTVNTAATASQTIYGFYGSLQVGTGVNAESITRARDTYADKQYWQENSTTEYATAKQTAYGTIESIFDETDDSGLGTILSNFATAWSTLANGASTDSNRTNVVSCGTELATKINDDVSQLQDLISTNNTAIELNVESVNQYTSSIAALNKQIVQTEATGGSANDLRDSRDLLVDKLSALVNVNVTEKANGSYSITSSGNTLVDEDSYTELATTTTSNSNYGVQDVTVVIKTTGTALNATDGKLKGLQDATTEAKSYIDDLGTMSAYLLTTFNTAHKAGYGLNDETGHNFFGTDGTDYSSLAYNSATGTWQMTVSSVTTDVNLTDVFNALETNSIFDESGGNSYVAAKDAAGTSTSTTADGDNATTLCNLIGSTKDSTLLGGATLEGYYTSTLTALGVDSAAVDRQVSTQTTIMTQVTDTRESTAGVNSSEELTNMIKFQQAYSASSRCLTTMDEMLDKLINSTGVVGR